MAQAGLGRVSRIISSPRMKSERPELVGDTASDSLDPFSVIILYAERRASGSICRETVGFRNTETYFARLPLAFFPFHRGRQPGAVSFFPSVFSSSPSSECVCVCVCVVAKLSPVHFTLIVDQHFPNG